mmetsp:Transcript_24058/g.48680  ORF Transcript_24058/g.48680 Transcript_24058/m.48680 type:complete len:286 (-) Transcript_24058:231-1088(-)
MRSANEKYIVDADRYVGGKSVREGWLQLLAITEGRKRSCHGRPGDFVVRERVWREVSGLDGKGERRRFLLGNQGPGLPVLGAPRDVGAFWGRTREGFGGQHVRAGGPTEAVGARHRRHERPPGARCSDRGEKVQARRRLAVRPRPPRATKDPPLDGNLRSAHFFSWVGASAVRLRSSEKKTEKGATLGYPGRKSTAGSSTEGRGDETAGFASGAGRERRSRCGIGVAARRPLASLVVRTDALRKPRRMTRLVRIGTIDCGSKGGRMGDSSVVWSPFPAGARWNLM